MSVSERLGVQKVGSDTKREIARYFAATSTRFHQPPPSAWKSAAVSEKRDACACTKAM